MMEKYLFLARFVNGTVQINNSADSTVHHWRLFPMTQKYENPIRGLLPSAGPEGTDNAQEQFLGILLCEILLQLIFFV